MYVEDKKFHHVEPASLKLPLALLAGASTLAGVATIAPPAQAQTGTVPADVSTAINNTSATVSAIGTLVAGAFVVTLLVLGIGWVSKTVKSVMGR